MIAFSGSELKRICLIKAKRVVMRAGLYVALVLVAGYMCFLGLTYYKKQYEFIDTGASLYEELQSRGHVEIGNYQFLKPNYMRIYDAFDGFIKALEKDDFCSEIVRFDEKFLSDKKNKKRYFNAPANTPNASVYFADESKKTFQFIKEYYGLMCAHGEAFLKQQAAAEFFAGMNSIDLMARDLFARVLDLLEKNRPGIKKIFYGNYNELTIVSRIVRYDQTENWGVIPHRDMCALSLLWDSDDKNDESLLLCEDTKKPCLKKLQKPLRIFSQKDSITSTILFPGLGCKKANIALDATLHAVAPIDRNYRHAVMSFLIVPDMYIPEEETIFVDADDEARAVCAKAALWKFFASNKKHFVRKTPRAIY